jgi:hypothetical protein
MCVCGGVTPLILQLDKIRKTSASPSGRFAHGEGIPFFISIEYDAGCVSEDAQRKIFCTCRGLKDVQP